MMIEYREIEFIPADWLDRAVFWPGLQVYSRPVRVPIDVPCPRRRKNEIEPLFQSVDLDHVEDLLAAYKN